MIASSNLHHCMHNYSNYNMKEPQLQQKRNRVGRSADRSTLTRALHNAVTNNHK